ncbi:hypothetical protein HC723_11735 [Vibrio sp. S11_S32]|uniref:hypothetical protein n=1 Tax=Vibrio sp. S11_S32 TaxID=2720225 RepID=UPI00167FF340|nr:hypothetical protein [Vibrio sp. S11_S32]MBD1577103.1 hypothetical protein [Vibrio sp. S11_S32]
MAAEDERTIDVMLDDLDELPPVLKGLNANELVLVFGGFIGGSVVLIVLLLLLLYPSLAIMGVPLGIGVGAMIAWKLAGKVGAAKQQTPSYIFWGGVMKNVQVNGINFIFFRLKIPFGFIKSQRWDNNSHKDGE